MCRQWRAVTGVSSRSDRSSPGDVSERCAETTEASRRMLRTIPRFSLSEARRSASSQSTGWPSETAAPSAINQASSGVPLNAHLHRQPQQRAADGDARGRHGRLAEKTGDLDVIEPE